jgi:hypothetical protein
MRERSHSRRRGGQSANLLELRARIAHEAARLMTDSGLRDYAAAKHKAALRLGVGDEAALPKNSEIEEALRAYQRLFEGDAHTQLLRALRETALEAMRFLSMFEPRLVGAVLDGTADRHSNVCLHLFSDDPDAPVRLLEEHGIPYETEQRRVRLTQDSYAEYPVLRFAADDTAIDLTVFPHDALRQPPLDRVDGKPMQRATRPQVEALLE